MNRSETILKKKLVTLLFNQKSMSRMNSLVVKKYEALPDDLQKEVIDFIEFLALKYQKQTTEYGSLAQKRASLFGNAREAITILPGFEDIPEGFDDYK